MPNHAVTARPLTTYRATQTSPYPLSLARTSPGGGGTVLAHGSPFPLQTHGRGSGKVSVSPMRRPCPLHCSPLCRRWPAALAVLASRVQRGQDPRAGKRAMRQQSHHDEAAVYGRTRLISTILLLDTNYRGALPMQGLCLLENRAEEQRCITDPFCYRRGRAGDQDLIRRAMSTNGR